MPTRAAYSGPAPRGLSTPGTQPYGDVQRWSVLRAAAWIGLLLVLSSMTYGLSLLATALEPTASAVSVTQNTVNASLVDAAVLEPSRRSQSAPWRIVTITAPDPVNGDRVQARCAVGADGVATDVFVLDPNDFSAVLEGLCPGGAIQGTGGKGATP